MAGEAQCEREETIEPAAEPSTDGESTVEVVASLRDALEQAQAEAQAQQDRALRAVAEAENVRKRSERDVESARKFALEKFVADLLPAVDSFERAAEAAGEVDAEGIRLSLKLLAEAMQRQGIAVVDPIGAPFDPNLHEAMSMVESDTAEPGSVITVFQKGYTVNGRLVRPARVVVARQPAPADQSAASEANDDGA